MSSARKSFILHLDSLSVLEDLTDDQRGQLFYAIYQYNLGVDLPLDPLIKIAFSQFKNQFIRDNEKYKAIVKRNKANGLKGGRPKNPKEPTGFSGNPNNPEKADSDSVSDNKSDSKSKKFIKPTFTEIDFYCKENNLHIDIQHFLDFYESKGWMVGKNKMKDWKATVRRATKWESNIVPDVGNPNNWMFGGHR